MLVSRPGLLGAAAKRVAVLGGVVVLTAPTVGPWIGGLVGLLVFALLFGFRLPRRPGIRVTAASQPALAALVADVAALSGVAAPDRIWLSEHARIVAVASGRRRDLQVGEALLACLGTAEIRALVAHELTLLRQPRRWLVLRLLRRYEDAETRWGEDLARPRLVGRDLTVLAPLAAEVHERADAAASAQVLTRAIALAVLASAEHVMFRRTYLPYVPWGETGKAGMRDLHEGWQAKVGYGVADHAWGSGLADVLAQVHPPLAAPLTALGEERLVLRRAPDTVHCGPLTPAQRRRLLARQAFGRRLRWTTFEQAPAAWWVERAAERASRIRQAARALLGRDASDLEIAQLVLTRSGALGQEMFGPSPWDTPGAQPAEPVDEGVLPTLVDNARPLVEDILFARGWRLEHPAVRGVMRGPAGERVDVAELVTGPITNPDISALADLLADAS